MLKAAVSVADTKVLLERSPGMRITTDILESAATGAPMALKGEGLVKLLLEHDPTAQVTPGIILASINSSRNPSTFMSTLLEHNPDLDITEDVLLTLLRKSMMPKEREQVPEVL